MTDALDIAGVASLTAAAFLIAIPVGFAVLGAALLGMSWAMTKRGRR